MAENLEVLLGDCRAVLPTLEAGSVQCCVTSPPYWNLRDYGTAQWEGGEAGCEHIEKRRLSTSTLMNDGRPNPGPKADNKWPGNPYRDACGKCGARRIDSQLGLESSPEEYIEKMVAVFREVWRVLRDDGTLWVNMGDSYAQSGGTLRGDDETKEAAQARQQRNGNSTGQHGGWEGRAFRAANTAKGGLKPKDLCMMPARLAMALQADGWYLRSEIIWAKPNPMPESVTDRPTKAHEYIFLLTKSERYFYDNDAIREPHTDIPHSRECKKKGISYNSVTSSAASKIGGWNDLPSTQHPLGRNKRSVWTIAEPEHVAKCPIDPAIVAALQADGWEIRVEPKPETVDRPTHSHEHIFLLTKSAKYFYDAEAIREPYVIGDGGRQRAALRGEKASRLSFANGSAQSGHGLDVTAYDSLGRNKRSVWTIATQPNSDSVYDFEGADYVDRRGIPRKWSPDCLIHERDGQPRRENHAAVSCGAPEAISRYDSGRIDVRPEIKLPAVDDPTACYKNYPAVDSFSCAQIDDISESKRSDDLDEAEREKQLHTKRIQSLSVPSMTDSDHLSCAELAILHNIGDRKSGHVGPMPNGDNVSGQLEFRIECKEPRLYGIERDGSIGANNTNPCNGHQKSTVEIVSRKNGKYSSTEDKCLCRISQVAHFATFPEEIPKLAILAGSKPGDTVLDPFAGSGTVGKVALELGRRAVLIELNPAYIELARDRTLVTPGFF